MNNPTDDQWIASDRTPAEEALYQTLLNNTFTHAIAMNMFLAARRCYESESTREMKAMKAQLGAVIERSATLEKERDEAYVSCNNLKKDRYQILAACAAKDEMLAVVYNWCTSDNPSDIDGDAVYKAMSPDCGKELLERYCVLDAKEKLQIKWRESFEASEKKVVELMKEVRELRSRNLEKANEIDQLNKALSLKLDAMPSGLSAGQSIALEKKVVELMNEVEALKGALRRARCCGSETELARMDKSRDEIYTQLREAQAKLEQIFRIVEPKEVQA